MASSSICVDASFVVRTLTGPGDQELRALWQLWADEARQVVAPSLIYYEVANALYRLRRFGHLGADAADLTLEAALALPLQLQSRPDLYRPAMALAQRFALGACYDAHYLVLAQDLETDFWTCDGRLARAVGKHLPWVRFVDTDPH